MLNPSLNTSLESNGFELASIRRPAFVLGSLILIGDAASPMITAPCCLVSLPMEEIYDAEEEDGETELYLKPHWHAVKLGLLHAAMAIAMPNSLTSAERLSLSTQLQSYFQAIS